jgi:hypothetical protein
LPANRESGGGPIQGKRRADLDHVFARKAIDVIFVIDDQQCAAAGDRVGPCPSS